MSVSSVSSAVGTDTVPTGASTTGARSDILAGNGELPLQVENGDMSSQAKGSASVKKSSGSRNKASAAARSRKRKARTKGSARATRAHAAAGEALPVEPKAWTTPLPLATRSLPRLDCAKLPPVLGDFCVGLSRELQVPEEHVLAYALGVAATCAQSTYSVEMYGKSTIQPTNLFILAPMTQTGRKRSVLKACMAPIGEWEAAQERELAPQINSESIQRMITRRAIRKLTNKAVDAQIARDTATLEELITQILDLENSISNPTVAPHLVVDTLAGLEEAIHQQHETMSLARADDNCLDVFSAASSRSARDLVLKAWEAGYYKVNRKSTHYSMRPRLTMTLAPRADILADPAKARLLQSRGLATRFLYLMPDATQTFTESAEGTEGARMPREVARTFFERALRLLPDSWARPNEAVTLTLCEEAQLMWLEYQDKADRLCREGELSAGLQEWTSMFAAEVVGRIAALFHLLSCEDPASDLVVSAEEMIHALELGDLLMEHAKLAWAMLLKETQADAARRVLDVATRNSWNIFSARDCFQVLKGQVLFRTMKPLNKALEILVEHGHIRTITVKGKSGRAMLRYELNPALVTWQRAEEVPSEAAETADALSAATASAAVADTEGQEKATHPVRSQSMAADGNEAA